MVRRKAVSLALSAAMVATTLSVIPAAKAEAAPSSDEISNSSLTAEIGDLGQISSLTINNNRTNSYGEEVNFVLPNDTSGQNNEAHQWMGEMIFSYRTSEDGTFPEGRDGFVEVDTNRTLAAGGSTTYDNASENLEDNPYIEKNVEDDKVSVTFKGQDPESEDERTMKGFDVESVFDMGTDDGSMLWSITLKNTSDDYIEFGDVGLPMPWNNKYANINDTYNNRMTVHTFAGADSGYAYAIRTSGEGNYMMFTPVAETGARIEYIDQWIGSSGGGMNGVQGTRNGDLYANWTSDTGGWFPGLQVYYIHSKDIQKTGRGYFTDATSLVLEPGAEKTYQFKFSAVRAGDNTPQESAEDHNNASDSVEERENNQRSVLYDEGMIDAVAVPGFQTAINMPTKLDLHYDPDQITDVHVEVQCVHENDPWDEEHIPEQVDGMVNNDKAVEHVDIAPEDEAKHVSDTEVDGEWHHIYELNFGCIGNNSVRVEYKLNGEQKFTQFEFNVLEELSETIEAHSDFMVNETQDNDPDSPTYGIYSDWYLSSGKDATQQTHWGDDWSHDNINFMTMKNYLDPEAEEIESIEKYLIDFMWNTYMKNTQDNYMVANYLSASGAYSDTASPYTRTYSEMMEVTGFFNMYRIEKAYPDLIDYREPAEWYLDKAYNIYYNRVGTGEIGFYGEQQVPQIIEALRDEGMTEEADKLQEKFALRKGSNMANAAYPYGSEFEYDNTGEEGAYAAAKALIDYYPDNENTDKALSNMERAEWKTRAMRGLQPTWYYYADPVFRGGESWWNFQYTASLAGSIMDDWLRYQDNGWDTDSGAWAQRMNYAAKLSNFNAVNMGQISDESVGAVSWRYTASKGGQGAQNVNDGGTRVMNNGWNDFSGESEEGLYGSLLRISADVATDPVFGLTGYGAEVSKDGSRYTVTPKDGIGKRINIIDDKVYVELEQDSCTTAVIDESGEYIDLAVNNTTGTEHVSKITLSGAGIADGFYSVKVNGAEGEQCYVSGNEGIAYAAVPAGESAQITIEKMEGGENQAPAIHAIETDEEPEALVPFRVEATAYDDGAPDGTLTYKWEVTDAPEGAELTFDADDNPYAEVTAALDGEYTVKLTVSDGELSTEAEKVITVGRAPEKAAPEISEASAVQNPTNTTVAELSGSAEADEVYGNDLEYAWSVIDQPEGGNAVIANGDQADALMKAYAPGSYTLRLTVTDRKSTVYDEDVSSYKDVTIEMTGNVDGIERGGTVITQAGTAPELPDTMEVIHPEGTVIDSAVVWDEIAEESYAEKGTFTTGGTVEGTDMRVEMTVMVVKGEAANIASIAQPSAIINTPQDLGGVAGLNDGYEPAASNDTSHGVWHNWLGEQGSDAWVQYDWDSEVTIYQSNAYYFKDGAGNFAPKEVWYEYKDANGEWRPLPNAQGCGTELDQYNVTTFDPVTTTSIRMNLSPKTLGCGVIEWQIMGYAENVIDKTQLRRVIDSANALDLDLFEATEEQIAQLQAAIEEAQRISDSSEVTQEEVDAAAAKLANLILTLPTADGNLAYSASVSTSYVSSWEVLGAVNDGIVRENSHNPSGPRYGSWGNASSYETVTYTWNSEVTLTGADIYFWYDGDEGNYFNGGINAPKEYYYEYLDSEGNWQQVANPSAYGIEMDGFNNTTFDEVTTTSIRITMMKQANDGNGVGIMEWKVYGTVPEPGTEAENIALQAAVSGICSYDGEEGRPYDQGGLPKMNDGIEPASSNDLSNGAWFNWNDRYDSDGNIQNAWVAYTWDEPMILESTDVYYFTDFGGHKMPESVTFEYLNDAGEWVEIADVTPGCEADQYNTTELGNIRTTALRMTMEPQFLNDGDPACGVGVIEWKVFGTKAGSEEEPVIKDALNAAIEEAEKRIEGEYLAEDWEAFQRVLESAKAVAADENADQTAVDEATALLNEAIEALDASKPEPPEDVDKEALAALIAEAESYIRTDYTEDSWAAFAEAFTNANSVNEDPAATQEDVDNAAAALKAAIEGLVEANPDVNLDEIRALIDEALDLDESAYTEESWQALQDVLAEAAAAAADPNATQDQIDALAKALGDAIAALEEAQPGEDPGKDPGEEPGEDPGKEPGKDPGKEPGKDPGQNPGGGTGTGTDKEPAGGTGADDSQNNGAAVQTGDNSPVMAYAVLAVIAAGAACVTVLRRRRG